MGAVDTTYTFTATDTITSAKMNNIIDQTTITTDAITGTTLDVASGKLKVRTQGITSNELAEGSVTSNAIADGTIVNADINASASIDFSKLATGALPATITVGSDNIGAGTIVAESIADAAITAPKLNGAQTGTAPIYGVRAWVNFNATSSADLGGTYVRDASTTVNITATAHGLIPGNKVFLDFTVGTGTAPFDGVYVVAATPAPTADTFSVASNVSTSSTGTVLLKRKSIRASGNVSCVSPSHLNPPTPPTSNQTVDSGYHIVNFSTAFPDENYAISGFSNYTSSAIAGFVGGNSTTEFTPESCEFTIGITTTGGAVNPSIVTAMFIR